MAMEPRVVSRETVVVASEDDIVLTRRKVRQLAEKLGFDPFTIAAITTATSELCRNIYVHAASGTTLVEEIATAGRTGIRAEFRDEGPGIPDIGRVLAGGYSTAKSLGLGVSGSKRLVDEFRIETIVGHGTVITVVKWKRAS
jgi:serine/threonine-protein kinase RsbT